MKPTDMHAIRMAAGLSQKQMAAKLGVHWNTYARWERGQLDPANPTMLERAVRDVEREHEKSAAKRKRGLPKTLPIR